MPARRFCAPALVATAFAVMATPVSGADLFDSGAFDAWLRGDAGTTSQIWDGFTDDVADGTGVITDSTPTTLNNANGTPQLDTTITGQFGTITGGGNIYSGFADIDFTVTVPELDVPTPPHDVTALVQIRGAGTALDLDSVLLNGVAPVDIAVGPEFGMVSQELGISPDGVTPIKLEEAAFLFNLPYAQFGDFTPGPQDLTLTFGSVTEHYSLEYVALDTAIRPFGFYTSEIPEPATLSLLALGSLAALRRHAH